MLDRAAGEHLGKAEDEYRRKYYAALDILIACNNQRFEENNYDMHVNLKQLMVKVAMCTSFEEECEKLVSFYCDDINSDLLKVQLKTLPAVIGLHFL